MTGTSGLRTVHVHGPLLDDEPALDDVLSVAVTAPGRSPCPAPDGRSAPRTARSCAPHAIVLDGTLPDLDGLQVLRRRRFEKPGLPVLMVTARDALDPRLDGPEAGVGDCVTESLFLEEVELRVCGPLRWAEFGCGRTEGSVRMLGDLVLTGDPREDRWAGVPVRLTMWAFALLSLLLGHPCQILGGRSFDDGGHSVEGHICSMRHRNDRGRATVIQTKRGLGSAIRAVGEKR